MLKKHNKFLSAIVQELGLKSPIIAPRPELPR
jgi:hypothetical protein